MERTHVATFRRQSGAKTRDPQTGRVSGTPVVLATGVPCLLQPSGKIVPGPGGVDIQVRALLFFSAADVPSSVELAPNDHVEITAGRRGQSLFRVHEANPATTRDGYFDDELVLVDTLEALNG